MIVKNSIPRVLFIGDTYPPFVGGSITMMKNLFVGLDLKQSALISKSADGNSPDNTGSIDYSTPEIDILKSDINGVSKKFLRGDRFGLPYLILLSICPQIVDKAVAVGREIDAQVVMCCWPSDAYTIAASVAARKLKLPLVVYYHSLWVETRIAFISKVIANYFEPKVLSFAKSILVATPPTADYLKSKLGVNCGVLEHSVDSQIWKLEKQELRIKNQPKKILMLGAVNKFNQDSVVAFSKAISSLPNIHLTILSSQSLDQLRNLGLDCSNISSNFCPRDKLKETILGADALYLALGFDTPIPKEVEVVIPTRLMDYLPTGIPIIAHGPSNTWTIQEASQRGWGYVIDQSKIESVIIMLREFLSLSLQEYSIIVSAAWREAERRDNKNLSKLFADYLWDSVK